MLERFWRSRSVVQTTPQIKNHEQNQNTHPNQSKDQIFLPNAIGCKIIEMEMQIEDGNLTKDILIQLLQQYTKAVEFYEERSDQRYKLYQKKLHNFLQKEAVDAVLKGRQNTSHMILKKQKAQQQIRKASNNSKAEVKKILESCQAGVEKQKKNIQKQMSMQMQSLEKRLQKKRSNSQYTKNKKSPALDSTQVDDPKLKILAELSEIPNLPKPKRQSIIRF